MNDAVMGDLEVAIQADGAGMKHRGVGDVVTEADRAAARALAQEIVAVCRRAGVNDTAIGAWLDGWSVVGLIVDGRGPAAVTRESASRRRLREEKEASQAQHPAFKRGAAVEAWRSTPVGLDGHRWPCPRAEKRGAECTNEGCGR